ncbi:MAG TPA: GatB/YqeY domain-containing protein [Anaerolineae bacterium]|nr:GatB/YqeY domain-containing protein [Anaerolineae bacterium]
MGLKEQLDQDLKDAMRAKDENRVRAIRMLKAAVSNFEFARTDPKNPDHNKPITEGDLLRVVENQIKQRRESIELYQKGNRPELVAQEQAEIATLEKYMPQQLSRDEIKAQVERVIADLNTREFPKVMKESAARLKGRADGKLVNEIVRELTSS